jgi:hypothetical protein
MIGLLCFVVAVLASPFKSKLRLEAENAVLRHQLIVLRRRLHGRVRLTNHLRRIERERAFGGLVVERRAMFGLVEQIVEAQDPIFANWRSKRERRPFRVACADIAGIGGCGGSKSTLWQSILTLRHDKQLASGFSVLLISTRRSGGSAANG